MPRANGPECGTKLKAHVAARRRLDQRAHLGIVAVLQRLIREQVALPERMMRRVARRAAGARAARHRADEELVGQAERRERHDRRQHRRREAARVRGVRRLDLRELLGHRAGELFEPRRCLMRVAVDGRIGGRVGEAEVGRRVDDDELDAGACGRRQQADR